MVFRLTDEIVKSNMSCFFDFIICLITNKKSKTLNFFIGQGNMGYRKQLKGISINSYM